MHFPYAVILSSCAENRVSCSRNGTVTCPNIPDVVLSPTDHQFDFGGLYDLNMKFNFIVLDLTRPAAV
jgi:hypothetical protein